MNININKQINIALVVVDQLITMSMKQFLFFGVCFLHFYRNLRNMLGIIHTYTHTHTYIYIYIYIYIYHNAIKWTRYHLH